MNKNEITKPAMHWFATYNNPDLTVARDYLEAWHTKHKASYVVG